MPHISFLHTGFVSLDFSWGRLVLIPFRLNTVLSEGMPPSTSLIASVSWFCRTISDTYRQYSLTTPVLKVVVNKWLPKKKAGSASGVNNG